MKDRILKACLAFFQKRCGHPESAVIDIIPKQGEDEGMFYCKVCGATRMRYRRFVQPGEFTGRGKIGLCVVLGPPGEWRAS